MRKAQPEFDLQVLICKYIKLKYPDLLFMSDTIASVKLTIPQQVRNKKIQKEDFHCPDLLIFQPKGMWHGLFLELKAKNIYKKDGTLLKNDHVEAQATTLLQLNDLGYYTDFAVGFDEAKFIIDRYMK
jgi:hypothetical protein